MIGPLLSLALLVTAGDDEASADHARARETYLAALFRARSAGSVEGVLRAAERFADLGDHTVVEQCLGVARSVAARSRDPRAEERVRSFTERWGARTRGADQQLFMP